MKNTKREGGSLTPKDKIKALEVAINGMRSEGVRLKKGFPEKRATGRKPMKSDAEILAAFKGLAEMTRLDLKDPRFIKARKAFGLLNSRRQRAKSRRLSHGS